MNEQELSTQYEKMSSQPAFELPPAQLNIRQQKESEQKKTFPKNEDPSILFPKDTDEKKVREIFVAWTTLTKIIFEKAEIYQLEWFVKQFNNICINFPPFSEITEEKEVLRVSRILLRISEDDIVKGLYKLQASSQLNGTGNMPRASIEFVTTYRNFVLIMNGVYDDGAHYTPRECSRFLAQQYAKAEKLRPPITSTRFNTTLRLEWNTEDLKF